MLKQFVAVNSLQLIALLTKASRMSFGPSVGRYVRAYNPVAAAKASAAVTVLHETFRHLLETST